MVVLGLAQRVHAMGARRRVVALRVTTPNAADIATLRTPPLMVAGP
jgi:hypothetical protein